MSVGSIWFDAFPEVDRQKIFDALCEAWRSLANSSKGTFHAGVREPKLTELLAEYVRATFRETTKLTGRWHYEAQQANLVTSAKGLVVKNRRRTDISYFTNKDDNPAELVFEFKKLQDTKTSRQNYIKEGVLRFVSEGYAKDQDVGVMVGVVVAPYLTCAKGLEKHLGGLTPSTLPVNIVSTGGKNTTAPSTITNRAHFDTQHIRTDQGGAPIIVSHIFLEL